MGGADAIVLTGWQQAREAYRSKYLRQAMYDEGAVIMEDCLLVLHDDDHRRRRRVENRLFRREVFAHWERSVLGATLEAVLAPFVAGGRADLRALGYRAAISLTATIAGVDHDPANVGHTSRLEGFVRTFSAGATLAHSTRDPDEVRSEVRTQLEAFRTEMLTASLDRRRHLLARLAAGELTEEDLPFEYQLARISSENKDSEDLLQSACDSFERTFILRALERTDWNVSGASRYLGVPLSTLKHKMGRLEIRELAKRLRRA